MAMTISEIEELTGVTRVNIRYYESEYLINPQKSENGFREYSLNDVDEIKKYYYYEFLIFRLEE